MKKFIGYLVLASVFIVGQGLMSGFDGPVMRGITSVVLKPAPEPSQWAKKIHESIKAKAGWEIMKGEAIEHKAADFQVKPTKEGAKDGKQTVSVCGLLTGQVDRTLNDTDLAYIAKAYDEYISWYNFQMLDQKVNRLTAPVQQANANGAEALPTPSEK